MGWMPFLCLFFGLFLGMRNLSLQILKRIDFVINIALIMLMVTIGANIGSNDSVMSNLPAIGFQCMVIAFSAILFSMVFTLITEKTVLPLEELQNQLQSENMDLNQEVDWRRESEKKTSPLIWVMPFSIIAGVLLGYFFLMEHGNAFLGDLLTFSLVVLYISVGISIGSNRTVFRYIKLLGFRIIYLSVAIFAGSMAGGYVSGLLFRIPLFLSVMSASGMSYYSITGAYMTQVYGIEAGTYGFLVNVMREFLTVLLLPLLVRVSKGSAIAGGAAGDMDTMLVPVTKFVGVELGLVALVTGTFLTFLVPFLLPILFRLFS